MNVMAYQMILVSILVPFLFGIVIYSVKQSTRLAEFLFVSCAFILLGLSIATTLVSDAGSFSQYSILNLMGTLELSFHSEPLGITFALLASTLFVVTSFYAIGYMRANQEKDLARFYACFCLSLSFVMGISYSGNLLTLFIFYELLTLATYPLVTHKRDQKALAGGRTYLGLLLGSSIGFLLIAILWTWAITDDVSFRMGGIFNANMNATVVLLLYTLFIIGTGKAGLFPLHRWLPAAMVAPTPVSALLHAVAVVKAGVFVVLKITVYIFGIDFLTATSASEIILYLAIITMIGASLIAITQDNLKARLAYSTIGQLAYIVLGATLATTQSITGATLHMLTHGLGKITLFFCAGAIYTAAHKTLVSELNGLARQMPITFTAFLLASISIIGLPPFAGAWSKWFLLEGAYNADNWIAIGAYLFSTVLAISYLSPIIVRGFSRNPENDHQGINTSLEKPLLCIVPLSLTAIGTLLLFFLIPAIYPFIAAMPLTQP